MKWCLNIDTKRIVQSTGKLDDALVCLTEALEIYRKTLPANHPDIATTLNNIGGVYHKQGKYNEALDHYWKAIEIKRKALSLDHPRLVATLDNFGFVYKALGDYDEALKYFKGFLLSFNRYILSFDLYVYLLFRWRTERNLP